MLAHVLGRNDPVSLASHNVHRHVDELVGGRDVWGRSLAIGLAVCAPGAVVKQQEPASPDPLQGQDGLPQPWMYRPQTPG